MTQLIRRGRFLKQPHGHKCSSPFYRTTYDFLGSFWRRRRTGLFILGIGMAIHFQNGHPQELSSNPSTDRISMLCTSLKPGSEMRVLWVISDYWTPCQKKSNISQPTFGYRRSGGKHAYVMKSGSEIRDKRIRRLFCLIDGYESQKIVAGKSDIFTTIIRNFTVTEKGRKRDESSLQRQTPLA